jgi:hypothetical protein
MPTLTDKINNLNDATAREVATRATWSVPDHGKDHETPREYGQRMGIAARNFLHTHRNDEVMEALRFYALLPSTDTSTSPIDAADTTEPTQAAKLAGLLTAEELATQVLELQESLRVQEAAREGAEGNLARFRTQVDAFKVEAGKIAMRYARENDWCSVAQEALGEMGIPIPSTRERTTVTITLEVEFDNNTSTAGETTPGFLGSSEDNDNAGDTFRWGLDGDFNDVNITSHTITYSQPSLVE